MSILNPREALALPKGSVRAILVLELVTAIVFIAMMVAVRAILGSSEDFAREAFLLVFGALASLANLGVGYYFGTRTAAEAK